MADQLTDEQISEFKDGDDQGRNTATLQTGYSYDVFLSFCGPDTRASFTGSLYRALTSEGFKVFMDDQAMKPGDRISRTLVNAIQRSRISIVVLSQNYASSTWCLDELVVILDCMRRKKQLVWPIFYRVAPSDVRHQRKSYAEAIAKHEESFGDESHEVQKWRSALTKVAGVQGWPDTAGQYDYELIEEIVKEARTELPREQLGGCLSKVSFIQAPPFAAQAPRNQAPGNSVNQPRQPPRPSLGELCNQAQPASRPSPGDLRDPAPVTQICRDPAPTTKPVVLPDHAKLVLKLDLHDDKDKQKALKASSTLSGIDAISMDMKEKKLTVIGTVDPVTVVSKLRKYWLVDIIAVGPAKEPAKEPEKKEEPKKDESKKDGEKKEEPKKEEGRQEGMKDEKKKEPAPDPVMEIVKARRAYNPHMTTHYYVQSMEEDPNACVIC